MLQWHTFSSTPVVLRGVYLTIMESTFIASSCRETALSTALSNMLLPDLRSWELAQQGGRFGRNPPPRRSLEGNGRGRYDARLVGTRDSGSFPGKTFDTFSGSPPAPGIRRSRPGRPWNHTPRVKLVVNGSAAPPAARRVPLSRNAARPLGAAAYRTGPRQAPALSRPRGGGGRTCLHHLPVKPIGTGPPPSPV